MTRKQFDACWDYISHRQSVITVQQREELEHIFNLMRDSDSYLEIGTAEGNSLYVLSHALREKAYIKYVDFGERHTFAPRNHIIEVLSWNDIDVHGVLGNSHSPQTLAAAQRADFAKYDCVLIDAGHQYADVIADAVMYGPLAAKYIFFHDIQLPEVNAAFEWYAHQRPDCEMSRFIRSETFGYGILRIK